MKIKDSDLMIKKKQAAKRLGRAVKSFDRYVKKHPDFPERFKDGDKQQSPVYYIEAEITDWINGCFKRKDETGSL